MTEMPYLCWAFLYTSTGVNSYFGGGDIYDEREQQGEFFAVRL